MERRTDDIRHEMERTRERIADTIQALRYKADVPSRVQEAVKGAVERAKETVAPAQEIAKDVAGRAKETVLHVKERYGNDS